MSEHIGIGIEKEIYGKNYYSYHYGYRSLNSSKTNNINLENIFFPFFENIPFNIIFLNVSKKGNYINFCLKNNNYELLEKQLNIFRFGDANSFSINLNDIGKKDIVHREIYPQPDLNKFNLDKFTSSIISNLIDKYNPHILALGFDTYKRELNTNDVHLELYPQKNKTSIELFLKNLRNFGVKNINSFEKYFLNYQKFSHIKIRIKNGDVSNIKYYRSINVNIPDFYNGK